MVILYVREEGCEDPWLFYMYVRKDVRIRGYFSKPKGDPRAKEFGGTLIQVIIQLMATCSGAADECAACGCNVK